MRNSEQALPYPGLSPQRIGATLDRLAAPLVLLHACTACSFAFFSKFNWAALLYDDFFYYLKVAENLASGHGSTFNGLAQTNGYHPLWLLMLTGASLVLRDGHEVFAFVCGVCIVSAVSTYWYARLVAEKAGVAPLLAIAIGLYVTAFSIKQYFSGMEAILVIPFALAFLARIQQSDAASSFAKAAVTGLLGSLMVLSRLDAAILMGMALLLHVSHRDVWKNLQVNALAGGALGVMPLIAYVASNWLFFDTLTPVSGMAKQLMPKGQLNTAVLDAILQSPWKFQVNVAFVLIALCLVLLSYKRTISLQRRVLIAAMLFPPLYFLLLSALTDWCFSDWYFYPIRIALCASASFVLSQSTLKDWSTKWFSVQIGAVSIAVVALFSSWWTVNPGQLYVYQAGADMAEFEQTHPGIYAMGDRAGKVGYLMRSPLVQLEGLVMDKAFVKMMVEQRPLLDVLHHYGVKYYIGSSHAPFEGCFKAVESYQAGPRSPKLQGQFCEEPIARFTHGDVETLVFEVR